MGANIKQIKTRIKSVDATLHITKAMHLVASSKVRRAQEVRAGASAYNDAMTAAVRGLLSRDTANSVFLSPPKTGMTCLVVIAGDRGLAGGYNGSVFRLLEDTLTDGPALLFPIGKRAADYCRSRQYPLFTDEVLSSERISDREIAAWTERLVRDYRKNRFDSLKVIGTKLRSVLFQEAEVTPLLPLTATENGNAATLICEPNAEALTERAVPDLVAARLTNAVRESFLCELYARRSAMDSASKNAEDMIDALNLQYNRARQSAITQEITEIVAGAEGQQ